MRAILSLCYAVTVLSASAGVLLFLFPAFVGGNAIQQTGASAMAIAMAVVPFAFTRAIQHWSALWYSPPEPARDLA